MSHSCILTGKKMSRGNNVSHSKRKTRRVFRANLQRKRLLNPATGRLMTVLISTRGLRTLQKWIQQGKKVDLHTVGEM